MTLAVKLRQPVVTGHARPRIAPPIPARSGIKAFRETATSMGIDLMPWQDTAARYLTATGKDGRHLYREVAIVVARQNGKTTLMKPYIIGALRSGKKVMHIAQNRELPRQMFGVIADALSGEPDLFPKRRGRTIWPRYGSGQEEIALVNGGSYRIAAASRGGGRGWPNDVVIIDELREMKDHEVMGAIEPTLTMSRDPQEIYLSNAGADDSVVLNAVRERAGKDASLAYLEWSAAPERNPDDVVGWAESNPAMGHYPSVRETLEKKYRSCQLAGTLAIFETEHLCRWVKTMREQLVDIEAWRAGEAVLEEQMAPFMAVSMDPGGRRASAAIAWTRPDATVGLRLLFDVTGNPIDTDRLGTDLLAVAKQLRVSLVGFDPLTDAVLAKKFQRTEPIASSKFANATARFVSTVESGKLKWSDAGAVGDDLLWTARKPHEFGSFEAVRAQDDRPITAILAAIRALWLASTQPAALPRPILRGF